MGLVRRDYIVYGYKLPLDIKNKYNNVSILDDEFLPMIEGHKGEEFSIIIFNNYKDFAFGLVLSKDSGDAYEGWKFIKLDFSKMDKEKVKTKYCEIFKIQKDEIIEEPYIFIFTKFS